MATITKHRTRLPEKSVREIFARKSYRHPGTGARTTAAAVARKYGVSEKAIRDIWAGRTWNKETRGLKSCDETYGSSETGFALDGQNGSLYSPAGSRFEPSEAQARNKTNAVLSSASVEADTNAVSHNRDSDCSNIFNYEAASKGIRDAAAMFERVNLLAQAQTRMHQRDQSIHFSHLPQPFTSATGRSAFTPFRRSRGVAVAIHRCTQEESIDRPEAHTVPYTATVPQPFWP